MHPKGCNDWHSFSSIAMSMMTAEGKINLPEPQEARMPKNKNKKITSPREWKGKKVAQDLDLPSGNVCKVQVVGAQAFLRAGTIPNSLLPIVTQALEQAEKGKARKLDTDALMLEIAKDPAKLTEIFEMADAVTVMTVLEPHVEPIPVADEDGEVPERDGDLLYVDEVDDEDKFFIMQFAMGGSRDLERFRNELAEGVDDLESSAGVDDDTESPIGATS